MQGEEGMVPVCTLTLNQVPVGRAL